MNLECVGKMVVCEAQSVPHLYTRYCSEPARIVRAAQNVFLVSYYTDEERQGLASHFHYRLKRAAIIIEQTPEEAIKYVQAYLSPISKSTDFKIEHIFILQEKMVCGNILGGITE